MSSLPTTGLACSRTRPSAMLRAVSIAGVVACPFAGLRRSPSRVPRPRRRRRRVAVRAGRPPPTSPGTGPSPGPAASTSSRRLPGSTARPSPGIRFSGHRLVRRCGRLPVLGAASRLPRPSRRTAAPGSFRVTPDGRLLLVAGGTRSRPGLAGPGVHRRARRQPIIDGPVPSAGADGATWFTPANCQRGAVARSGGRGSARERHRLPDPASQPTPAQLREDAAAYEAMLYLFRDWDRAHGIKPRPVP